MKKVGILLFSAMALGILSCSVDDLNEESGTDSKKDDFISSKFIATLESWTDRPKTATEWVHETNSEGELTKSFLYEIYPKRLLWALEYLDYNEDLLPTAYEKRYYKYGEVDDIVSWWVHYNEDQSIETLTAYRDDSYSHEWNFSELDDTGRVLGVFYIDGTGALDYWEPFNYGKDGNWSSKARFSITYGDEEADLLGEWNYYYTHFGDYKSVAFNDGGNGIVDETVYSYRDDHTLKSSLYVGTTEGYSDYISEMEFDEEEKISYETITYGDERWDYVAFFPNGYIKVMEYYLQDELLMVRTYAEDNSSEIKLLDPEDGTYRIEFLDSEEIVYKVEYYDADENLIDTKHYKRSIQINKPPIKMENHPYSTGMENARK